MILVTGGAGFIGANFVLDWLAASDEPVINLDALTYAGNRETLAPLEGDARHLFVHGDICDRALVERLFAEHKARAVVHFAAESHVDRSIHGPGAFVRTNVDGTFTLLEAARMHWSALPAGEREAFRFLHVSTDEVYGSLGPNDPAFTETKAYEPNSPYSASKAASDHLVRAWHHTYGLPVLTTNCSNNYGPYQFPEKLIPLMIANASEGRSLPVYGDGKNVRDWIHVVDHCRGIRAAMERGARGEVYNFGGDAERENLFVVKEILRLCGKGEDLITYVKDRPGHDRRYAMDSSKARATLGWTPGYTFEEGLEQTVTWYMENRHWWERVRSGEYQSYYAQQYGGR